MICALVFAADQLGGAAGPGGGRVVLSRFVIGKGSDSISVLERGAVDGSIIGGVSASRGAAWVLRRSARRSLTVDGDTELVDGWELDPVKRDKDG